MEKRYLLGFDVGTYESKGVLAAPDGRIVGRAARGHLLKSPHPGWAEHDPIGDWWSDFRAIVAQLLADSGVRAGEIAGIGISAVMAAITPVDENCNPLRNAILYGIDTRCTAQAQALTTQIGPERMNRIFGGPCTVEHFGPKILWIKENEPEVYRRAKHFTIASGFLTAKLTGEYWVDRYSVKSAVPMLDPRTMEWNDEFCRLVCPRETLPRITSTTQVVGYVTAAAAAETGLAAGTPVICGTTDAGAEAVSVGVVEEGDAMLMYGSTTFFARLSREARPGTGVWMGDYVLDGLYAYTGGMATTGSLTRWLRDNTAKELLEREAQGRLNAYDALFSEAEGIPPGSDGLVVLPYFQGERMPVLDPRARGAYFGLNLRHTRGHLVHAAFEGVGYGVAQNFELLRSAGMPVDTVTAVGGGTKTPQWLQVVSDICNVRQQVPEVTVGASYGDALLAGLGVGLIPSPSRIREMVRIRYVVEPDPGRHAAYEPDKKVYRELYQRNKDLMHLLGEVSGWT